jgi:hypothetical protein
MKVDRRRRALWWLMAHDDWPVWALAVIIPAFVAWVTAALVTGR